jgi:hypothetical protein
MNSSLTKNMIYRKVNSNFRMDAEFENGLNRKVLGLG